MPAPKRRATRLVRRWKRRLLAWLAVHVFGRLVLPALLRTWRIETDFSAHWLERARAGERVILAFWHNRQLGLIRLASRLRPVSVLVSRHGDGEIITRIVSRFGVGAVRGSSTRGGRAALKGMIAATLRTNVAITPDGPLGPRYELKPGVITLAAMTGLPVFWVTWSADRVWVFKSWDRLLLPKPFARVRYRADGPLILDHAADPRAQVAAGRDLELRMRAQTAALDDDMGQEIDPILAV